MIESYIRVCEGKIEETHRNTFLLAIFAGMFIAFGASSSNVAVDAIENTGLAKFVAGMVFPVGLMLILTVAGELFTGDCMLILGGMDSRYTTVDTIKKLILVYFGNLAGSLILVFLLYQSGQFQMSQGAVGAYTIKVASGKLQYTFWQCIASGILCNILVCAAVLMASRVKSVPGKMITVFFPIMAFVIGGFEHCVANMYYLPAGIAAAGNALYVERAQELYGITSEAVSQLTVSNMIIKNLIPVTIGNMIGGMVFVALPLYMLSRKKNA